MISLKHPHCLKVHRDKKGQLYVIIPKKYKPTEDYYFWNVEKCNKSHKKEKK
jgi:hypothetical protein